MRLTRQGGMPMNDKLRRVILIILCGILLIGGVVSLLIYRQWKERESAFSVLTIPFRQLNLIPGESCEYPIPLEDRSVEVFEFRFVSTDYEQQNLQDFVTVQVIVNGEVLCDKLLRTVMDNEDEILLVDLTGCTERNIKVIYSMSPEIGDEAQEAEADFRLEISGRKNATTASASASALESES